MGLLWFHIYVPLRIHHNDPTAERLPEQGDDVVNQASLENQTDLLTNHQR